MPRKNVRFYKSKSTSDLLKNIKQCFRHTSAISRELATGRFFRSGFSGTSLEPLDIFRASQIAMQDVTSTYLKNAVISMLYDNHRSHHSLAAFLSAHFIACECDVAIKDIMLQSRCATIHDADDLYSTLVRDERTREIFESIRESGGSSAKLTIQQTPAKSDAVIHKKNNVYPLSVPKEFWRYCRKEKIELLGSDVLVVDGVIMSIGEINGLLLSAHESKRPFIIVCRGMSEEVLATLLTNYSMGRLNAFLVQVPMNESANLLHDLAYLSNANVVSTITGDVLASKDEECLGRFERVVITKDNIEFVLNDPTRAHDLVAKIEDEKKEYENEFGIGGELLSVFELRKQAASSEVCKVYISQCGIGQGEIISDRLKSLSLIHGEMKENGIVDIKNLSENAFKELGHMGFRVLPVTSLIYAIRSSQDLRKKILGSSRVLVLD